MAENKTQPTQRDAGSFIDAVPDLQKRADARTVAALMARLSGEEARLWGPSIIGFGSYHYRYESGREGDAPRIAFSPRSTSLVLYLSDGFSGHAGLLERLGKHKTGKSCLYIKRLSDVDEGVLEEMVASSLAHLEVKYPA